MIRPGRRLSRCRCSNRRVGSLFYIPTKPRATQESQLSDTVAKLTIYRAFVEAELEAPRHLDRKVHDLYFRPAYPEFEPRTLLSLSNAFTSAFKELEPIPQFRVTAKLAGFLERS